MAAEQWPLCKVRRHKRRPQQRCHNKCKGMRTQAKGHQGKAGGGDTLRTTRGRDRTDVLKDNQKSPHPATKRHLAVQACPTTQQCPHTSRVTTKGQGRRREGARESPKAPGTHRKTLKGNPSLSKKKKKARWWGSRTPCELLVGHPEPTNPTAPSTQQRANYGRWSGECWLQKPANTRPACGAGSPSG
jgi:hypothetical protein